MEQQFGYKGMMQDLGKSKHPWEFYWDALNVKITATDNQNAAVLTNEKGNKKIIEFPQIIINPNTNIINVGDIENISYSNESGLKSQLLLGELQQSSDTHTILGMQKTRDSLIIMTTDNRGMDCIWEVNDILRDTQKLNLLYLRKMGFSVERPIEIQFNYENENIQKIYWLDGSDQIKSINIKHNLIKGNSSLMDITLESLDSVGTVSFSQPVITDIITGGSHTAGMIQYAYNLYRLNSSQTKISPLSKLVPLGKLVGGGELNEVVGDTPVVTINDIDTSYDTIQIFAVKYTSFNQIPSVSLIADREISGESITVYDDGGIISTLDLQEFLFLGSDPLIPQHIGTKDGRMFLFNIKSKNFILPDKLDMRAYSFNFASRANVIDSEGSSLSATNYGVPFTHDAINGNYGLYKFQKDAVTVGGEGPYLKYEIVSKSVDKPDEKRFFKDNEVYRLAIIFYNRRGQTSLPRWIADFQAPIGNLKGKYNTLKVTLKPSFDNFIASLNLDDEDGKPIGYKILRAQRTSNDKTIVCQGLVSTMMVNSPREKRTDKFYNLSQKQEDSKNQVKLPNLLVRNNAQVKPLQPAVHLQRMQLINNTLDEGEVPNINVFTGPLVNALTEVQYDSRQRKADTYQYNVMMQMYSPDITFGNESFTSGMSIDFVGAAKNVDNSYWGQHRAIETKIIDRECKVNNGIHPSDSNANTLRIKGTASFLMDRGLISDPNGSDPDNDVAFNQFYRKYDNIVDSNIVKSNIYGVPEITEKGQGRTAYANNSKYEYSNNLQGFLSDGERDFGDTNELQRSIINVNSEGAKCVTFVLGSSDDVDPHSRPTWENIYNSMNIDSADNDSCLIAEITKNEDFKYFGSIYGGTSYEAKKRTNYLAIGEYSPIQDKTIQIDSPGDTFVQDFRFTRISKTDTEVYSLGTLQYTEIVEFKVETTVDLSNRNDSSFANWDSDFQPRYDDFHKYNKVYSQEADLITETDLDYNQKLVNDFDTRVQATKIKIPNESIDSWTDYLVNETIDLDGKYGPINGIVNSNDNIFALQDEAVSLISINPRVTVSSADGVPTELGTGRILSDYRYLTTNSGTLNKWSILSSSSSFYYFDLLNKTWMRQRGGQIEDIVESKGMTSHFRNNIEFDKIINDNPILNSGISTGYDILNNTVYITLLQDNPFTISFNERTDSFVSFHSYLPSFYIQKGSKLISTSPGNNKLYEHNVGEYNTYYDEKQEWGITYQANPQTKDNVFNNLMFKGECYDNGIDIPLQTFNEIRGYNEYQDSGNVPLVLGSNMQRKFRVWRITIPRDQVSKLDRLRGHWVKIRLSNTDPNNYEYIIHNMTLSFTGYPN